MAEKKKKFSVAWITGGASIVFVLAIVVLVIVNALAMGIPTPVFIALGIVTALLLGTNLWSNRGFFKKSTSKRSSIELTENFSIRPEPATTNEHDLTSDQILADMAATQDDSFETRCTAAMLDSPSFLSAFIYELKKKPMIQEVKLIMPAEGFSNAQSAINRLNSYAAGVYHWAIVVLNSEQTSTAPSEDDRPARNWFIRGNKVAPAIIPPAEPTAHQAETSSAEQVSADSVPPAKPAPVVNPKLLIKAEEMYAEGQQRQTAFTEQRYHDVLGIEEAAMWDKAAIDIAIKKTGLKWHPDKYLICEWSSDKVKDSRITEEFYKAQFILTYEAIDAWAKKNPGVHSDNYLAALYRYFNLIDVMIAESQERSELYSALSNGLATRTSEVLALGHELDATMAASEALDEHLNETVTCLAISNAQLRTGMEEFDEAKAQKQASISSANLAIASTRKTTALVMKALREIAESERTNGEWDTQQTEAADAVLDAVNLSAFFTPMRDEIANIPPNTDESNSASNLNFKTLAPSIA